MGMYKYMREAWKSPRKNILKESMKSTLIEWRKQPSTVRILKPTRIDKARSLGYRAKQGILVVRQKVQRGGRMNVKPAGGRRSKRQSRRKDLNVSYQTIAEQRVAAKYTNCEVLNSYYVAEDGHYFWYEVIIVDKTHPAIMKDKVLKWITEPKANQRVKRGLTSSAKKSRGLRNKGIGAEKVRPSSKANGNRLK